MSKQKNEVDKNAVEKTIVKARYWWFVLYPESAPTDWRDRIQMTGLPFVVSPFHDKDIDDDGTPKKPHYHVIICWSGPTTYNNVKKNITDPLGQPHPQYLMSMKGAYRYLTHKDNPNKYQYDDSELQKFNGFDIQDYAELSISDEDRCYVVIENVIYENAITELHELVAFLKTHEMNDLLSFLRRHTYYIDRILSSLRHSRYFENDNASLIKVDPSTGEVINS